MCVGVKNKQEDESRKKIKPSLRQKKKQLRRVWPLAEKELLLAHFKRLIKIQEVPGKEQCKEFLSKDEILASHFFSKLTWRDIKYWVYNQIQSVKNRKSNFCLDQF